MIVYGDCVLTTAKRASVPTQATETINCGRASSAANKLWDPRCGSPKTCYRNVMHRRAQVDTYAKLTFVNGRWTDPQTWCPSKARPGIDLAALRDRAIRLLPAVGIGSAWTTTALVNTQTILWARTAPDRPLAEVTVAGIRVQLRVHFTRAQWNYGDGTRETADSPGKPYDPVGDPCRTAQCPHYRGHTYLTTGRMTITLAVTWHAQYRAAASTWTDIDGDITGPVAQHVITVKEARGILVPDPGDH